MKNFNFNFFNFFNFLIAFLLLLSGCKKEEIKPSYPDSYGQGVILTITYANIGVVQSDKNGVIPLTEQALVNIYDGNFEINENNTFNGAGFNGTIFKQGGGHVLPEKVSGGKKLYENHIAGNKTYVVSIKVKDSKFSNDGEQHYFTASTYMRRNIHKDSAIVATVYFPSNDVLNNPNKTKNRFLIETAKDYKTALKEGKVFWNVKVVANEK